MDIKYLKGRFEHAKALDADIVKIDTEEFASLLNWIDEVDNRIVDAIEHGYKLGKNETIRKAISKLEELKGCEENKIETIKNPEEQLFDKLLNTKFKAWGDISLNDIHERHNICDMDEGWDNCFDTFCEAISMLQEKNPETIFKETKDACDSYHDGFCDILGRQLTAEEDAGCCHSCQATQKGCD